MRTTLPLILCSLLWVGCDKPTTPEASPPAAKAPAKPTPSNAEVPEGPEPPATAPTPAGSFITASHERDPSKLPGAARVVAIGDVHGDYDATVRVLKLVGAIDDELKWSGGKLVLVQTGDQLDRGDGEQRIVDLFESLRGQALAAGGRVVALNGNHEIMNAQGDLRYVTPRGLADFEDAVPASLKARPGLARAPEPARARLAAFLPGGPYARILGTRNVMVIVGDTAFAHGGIRPQTADAGLEALNAETSKWLEGASPQPPSLLVEPEGPIWTRKYSAGVDAAACADLDVALGKLGVKRMVVGHTVQAQGINPACDGKVWRIDVGLASHYGSAPSQALEIVGDEVRVLVGDPE